MEIKVIASNKSPLSLIAAFYADAAKAKEKLTVLQKMEKDGAIELLDAAVMTKNADSGKLTITEQAELTSKKGAIGGALAGGLLAIIFPPSILALGAVGAAAGAAIGHFTDQGFDNNLLREIGENLPAGGSALVAVIEETWLERLSTAMEGYADLSRFTLDAEAGARLVSHDRS